MQQQDEDPDDEESFHIPTSDVESSVESESDDSMDPRNLAVSEPARHTRAMQATHFTHVEIWQGC